MVEFGQTFTKGDRVRVTGSIYKDSANREGTVVKVQNKHEVQVHLDGEKTGWWFIAWQLERCGDVQEGML